MGESALVAGLAVLAFMVTPPAKIFVEGITSQQMWHGLQTRLLPKEHWFGIDIEAYRSRLAARVPAGLSDLSTGSIKAIEAPSAQGAPEPRAEPKE